MDAKEITKLWPIERLKLLTKLCKDGDEASIREAMKFFHALIDVSPGPY